MNLSYIEVKLMKVSKSIVLCVAFVGHVVLDGMNTPASLRYDHIRVNLKLLENITLNPRFPNTDMNKPLGP